MMEIKNLKAKVKDKKILKGINLLINKNETHVIMGPNGSGKSTLANVLMGNPKYEIASGDIIFKNKKINDMDASERAKLGIFMAFQYPREIAGVQLGRFLYMAYSSAVKPRGKNKNILSVFEFNKILKKAAGNLRLNQEFLERSLNVGFSGGEKKKCEMMQLEILKPDFAILDETDSGLDVDALKVVGRAVNRYKNKNNSVLIITHYNRILDYIKPDKVHVMVDGKIIKSGGYALIKTLEKEGYEKYAK